MASNCQIGISFKKKFGYFAYLYEGIKDFLKPIKSYKVRYEVNGIKKTGYFSFILIIYNLILIFNRLRKRN